MLKFENHLYKCCNILAAGGEGRGCCLKFLKPRKAKGKLSACCTFHLPFLMDTFGSCCAGSVISPYPWAFPGSFSLLRGTGSIMEEGASRGRGTKEGWRIWEVGEEDPMSWKKKGLGMDGHLTHPCFLPLYPWPFWIVFSNKNIPRTHMFRICQKKSLGEVALVYSQLRINAVKIFF